ncbi:LuxR C-terminal-related transcriptional regulator [Ruminococcaceae bacterium OttesenSCG-928-L11]|nr:LuxR C-terminal-related transcriptional regulator [Ruminococcaceae bacterium OttesenSCG-928-L11]
MGQQRRTLPLGAELLHRPRVAQLIEQGLKQPLLMVTAAPGYGKTHEMASYLAGADVRLGWMRVTRMDSLTHHFWESLLHTLRPEFPAMAGKMAEIGFPGNLSAMKRILRIASEEIDGGALAVLVLDDFDLMENEEILHLLEAWSGAGLENCCLVLMGRSDACMKSIARAIPGTAARLTTEQLKFTRDEMRARFRGLHIQLPREDEARLYRESDGWPLMLDLLARQMKRGAGGAAPALSRDLLLLQKMFDKESYSCYPPEMRRVLLRLSLPGDIVLSLVERLEEETGLAIRPVLQAHMYVTYESERGRFTFQNMYREFLQGRQSLLSAEERRRTYCAAGDCAMEREELYHAAEYYEQGECFDGMLEAAVRLFEKYASRQALRAEYLLEKIRKLPESVTRNNYLAGSIRACMHIQMLQPEEAMAVLAEMENSLLAEDSPLARERLGEVYERMAGVQMLLHREIFVDYYKKAGQYLPGGAGKRSRDTMRFMNTSVLSVQDYEPGSLRRMEQKLHEGITDIVRVENGAEGFDYLFSTEAAYHTLDLDRAEYMARCAIEAAMGGRQYDIVCNALLVLARVDCMRGDYQSLCGHIETIRRYAADWNRWETDEMMRYAVNWFALAMDDSRDISSWIVTAESEIGSKMPLAIGREELLYAEYLLRIEKYEKMIAFLDNVKDWFMAKGWIERVNANVLLAAAYGRMDKHRQAAELLEEAYAMTVHNGIIAPFVERGRDMCSLLEQVSAAGTCTLDAAWVREVSEKAAACQKQMDQMRSLHAQGTKRPPISAVRLTERETETLHYLSQGLTREEIAEALCISVNTVKTYIKSIYSKLGAVNRADAVRLGLSAGLIR